MGRNVIVLTAKAAPYLTWLSGTQIASLLSAALLSGAGANAQTVNTATTGVVIPQQVVRIGVVQQSGRGRRGPTRAVTGSTAGSPHSQWSSVSQPLTIDSNAELSRKCDGVVIPAGGPPGSP